MSTILNMKFDEDDEDEEYLPENVLLSREYSRLGGSKRRLSSTVAKREIKRMKHTQWVQINGPKKNFTLLPTEILCHMLKFLRPVASSYRYVDILARDVIDFNNLGRVNAEMNRAVNIKVEPRGSITFIEKIFFPTVSCFVWHCQTYLLQFATIIQREPERWYTAFPMASAKTKTFSGTLISHFRMANFLHQKYGNVARASAVMKEFEMTEKKKLLAKKQKHEIWQMKITHLAEEQEAAGHPVPSCVLAAARELQHKRTNAYMLPHIFNLVYHDIIHPKWECVRDMLATLSRAGWGCSYIPKKPLVHEFGKPHWPTLEEFELVHLAGISSLFEKLKIILMLTTSGLDQPNPLTNVSVDMDGNWVGTNDDDIFLLAYPTIVAAIRMERCNEKKHFLRPLSE